MQNNKDKLMQHVCFLYPFLIAIQPAEIEANNFKIKAQLESKVYEFLNFEKAKQTIFPSSNPQISQGNVAIFIL
jgi:hypothetical protein